MQEPKGIFCVSHNRSAKLARHLAAPPLRQNQASVVWYGDPDRRHLCRERPLNAGRIDLWQGVHFHFRVLHARWDTSWPFYLWAA